MSGKPYISVKRASTKAAKAPSDRQSRGVRGRAKLKAKKTKTAELMKTRLQRP